MNETKELVLHWNVDEKENGTSSFYEIEFSQKFASYVNIEPDIIHLNGTNGSRTILVRGLQPGQFIVTTNIHSDFSDYLE